MNVLTDCVNLQGDKVTTSTGPTSNSLLRISVCQHVLALGKPLNSHNIKTSDFPFVYGTFTNSSAIFNSNQNFVIPSPQQNSKPDQLIRYTGIDKKHALSFI